MSTVATMKACKLLNPRHVTTLSLQVAEKTITKKLLAASLADCLLAG
jgi:hypothetical protein